MSEKSESTEVLTAIGESIPGFEHNGSIYYVSQCETMLAVKLNDGVYIYDVSADVWKVITIIETNIDISNIELYKDRVVLSGDTWGTRLGKLSIYNVADGSVILECEHPYMYIGLDLQGDDLFLAHKDGLTHLNIENGTFTDVGFVPDPKSPERTHGMYNSYGKDVVVSDNYVYINGRHIGVNVFKREENNQLVFIKSVGPRYTPTKMQWLKEQETLLLLGDTVVLVVDVTQPEKPKMLPTASFKKSEVELGLWDGDNFLTLVSPISQRKKIKLASIDLTDAPTLVDEYTFAREDDASPKAIVLNGHRLTIIYSETMSVFEYAGFSKGHSDKFEAAIKELRNSDSGALISSTLDSLAALNKKLLVKNIAANLEKSFKSWAKTKPEGVLESVNFEWPGHVAEPADYNAQAYATSDQFSLSGFNVGFAYQIVDQLDINDQRIEETISEVQAIADDLTYSVFKEAFAVAAKSTAFKKLNKADVLSFTMNSHEDTPIEVFNYTS